MIQYLFGLTITGIISGIFAGLFGSGAEIIVVPLLTFFNIFDNLKLRIGTSLFMLLPPIGVFAAYKFIKNDFVDVFAALYMAFIFTIASYFSAGYLINVDGNYLRKLFGVFTIFSGFYIFFSNEK